MDIIVPLTQDEWNAVAILGQRMDNYELSEEEYVDELMAILGPKFPTQPQEGDDVHLQLEKRVIVSVPKETPIV